MRLLGTLLKQGIRLRNSIEQEIKSPFKLQAKQLLHLLEMAEHTRLGEAYKFNDIIKILRHSKKDDKAFYELYKQNVPLFDYNKMYNTWWHLAREGEADVAWRGKVKYFALSSGTSEAASKYIPVTADMVKAIKRTSLQQILSLANFPDVPARIYGKGMLMLGGSTDLNTYKDHFEGDLSGITASQIPFWFQHFYKPGKQIAKNRDWDKKLNDIAEQAPKWDIGFVVGVPAWIQMVIERIIEKYKVKNIHEIWPNLEVYTHGGVSFEPYKKGFQKLLGHPITYIETYLASEGFIAYQTHPDREMSLALNTGIFYEFVPFDEKNFNADGELLPDAQTLMIDEVEEGKNYALLLSTCAGAWRYLIGDTVKFVDKPTSQIVITGRTKHFLSLCGEHLSVDNMNRAIEHIADELNIRIKEFTVVGVPYGTLFGHQWYIGTDDPADTTIVTEKLDQKLRELNDDYHTERNHALGKIAVQLLPTSAFMDWMEMKGKVGGQNKFPRVLKKNQHEEFVQLMQQKGYI
jgi:hypothetical protein